MPTIQLRDGPYSGIALDLPTELKPSISLPIDEQGRPCQGPPFALAGYVRTDEPHTYSYHSIRHSPGRPFQIEYVGGPAPGIRTAPLPARYMDEVQEVPVDPSGETYQPGRKIGGAAIYRRQEVEGRWKFCFDRIDDSEKKIGDLELERNEAVLAELIERFYREPDYKIYTVKPTDEHQQVEVRAAHRSANVDVKLAPVIELVWQLGLDTVGSCQERPPKLDKPGRAYIGFWRARQGREFEQILRCASIECECVVMAREYKTKAECVPEQESFTYDGANVLFHPSDMHRVVDALRSAVESSKPSATPQTPPA